MNKKTFSEVRVQIEPHMNAVDRTLTFFEKENSQVKLQLKDFKTGLELQRSLLISPTQQDVSLVEQSGQDLLDLTVETGQMNQVKTLGLICYPDSYKSEILRLWTIRIQCAKQIKIKEFIYRESVQKIGFFGTSCNRVKFISSDPYFVDVMAPFNSDFSTVEGAYNPIRVSVFTDKLSTETCILRCLSAADGAILHSWIVELTGVQPKVSQYLEVQSKSTIVFKYKLKEISRTAKEIEYQSSNTNIFKIERPNIDKSGEEEEVFLKFDNRIHDRTEFFMYIVDKVSQNVLDCVMFCVQPGVSIGGRQ